VFLLSLLLVVLVFLALFFFLAAVSPDLHIAKPAAMVFLLLFILFAGFIVSKDQLPDWLIWLYWIDPVAWAVRSAVVSQYRHHELDTCVYGGVDYCTNYGGLTMGQYALSLFDVPSDKGWVWYGIIFMLASYVFFMVLAYIVLEYHRYERPEHISLFNHELRQQIAAAGSEQEEEEAYALVTTPRSSETDKNSGNNGVVAVPIHDEGLKVPPVTVAFHDLWYTVTIPADGEQPAHPIDLLKGITGFALPGTITALMGATGAGKTTLMDVVAGRKTGGTIKGSVLLNGFEASDLAVRRCTGYCEQMDVHSEASTFREALTFSAFLRQSAEEPREQKLASVQECLDLLALNEIADQIIRGSNMEQMKRLTIGVELAARPSVLFLDEPTSGLDARSAKVIMDGVRKVADSGRTVLCTIHQPSLDVFSLFDNLLLLQRGGEMVYFGELGEGSRALISYFEALPNVPCIRPGYNPATWMLEVIGAGVNKQHAQRQQQLQQQQLEADDSSVSATKDVESQDFARIFKTSAAKRALDERLEEPGLFRPSETLERVTFARKRAATSATQLGFLMKRFNAAYWRTPSYNWTRLVIALFLGLLFGLVYVSAEYTTYQGINGGLGMVFLSTIFIGIVSFISILPLAFEERAAFYRERASQTYNTLWFFVAFTVVEIPYVLVSALVFTVLFFPMVGFTGFATAIAYWLTVALHILFQAYLGQLLIFALPSIEVAAIIGILYNALFLMVSGFNPPTRQLPTGYKWLFNISPQRYAFATLSALVFGDCAEETEKEIAMASYQGVPIDLSGSPLGCQIVENAPASIGQAPVKEYIDAVFSIKHEHIAEYVALTLAMLVVFRVLAVLAMRYINHQRR